MIGKSTKVAFGVGLVSIAILIGAALIPLTTGKSLGHDLVVSTPLIVEGDYGWLNGTTLVGRRRISKTECTSSMPDKGPCYQYFLWEIGAKDTRPFFPPGSDLEKTLQKTFGAICISDGKLVLSWVAEKLPDARQKFSYDIFDPAGSHQRQIQIPEKPVPWPRGYSSPIKDNCKRATNQNIGDVYWLPMRQGSSVGFGTDIYRGKPTFAYLYDANGQQGQKIFDEALLVDRGCVGYGSKNFDGSVVLTGCMPQRNLPRTTIDNRPECQPMHVLRANGSIERYACMPKAPDGLGSWSRFELTKVGAFGIFGSGGPEEPASLYLLKPGESRLTEILTDRVQRIQISPDGCWLAYQQRILGQSRGIDSASVVRVIKLC